jgi:DNA-directed RNA polymerase subunit RPC12/RpoP
MNEQPNYVCRLCLKQIHLKSRDMIRCPECEGRILYKQQTPGTVRKYKAI